MFTRRVSASASASAASCRVACFRPQLRQLHGWVRIQYLRPTHHLRSPTRLPFHHHYPPFHHHQQQTRHLTLPRGVRNILRQDPIIGTIAIISVLLAASGFVYSIWYNVKVRASYGAYPEPIAIKIRRGIYFTDTSPDRAQAVKAFVDAINMAKEAGMHPLSNEVMAIYTELARMYVSVGGMAQAIDIYTQLKERSLEWIEKFGQGEDVRGERTRLLSRACVYAVKLAELCTSEYAPDPERCHEELVWAVTTTMKERRRREVEGVKEGEGPWQSDDEVGSQMEALAHSYESNSNHYFATLLFQQALILRGPAAIDCHTVTLLSNIAASIAQSTPPTNPPPPRAALVAAASTYAARALALAASLSPPLRTAECDRGCAVATHNLGEFREMLGDVEGARERYEEAASLANAIGFEEGVVAAEEGLRRLGRGGTGLEGGRKKGGWWGR